MESLPTMDVLFGFIVALGLGLLIGIERERPKGDGPDRSAAGVRSFTLVALMGALGMHLGLPVMLLAGAFVGLAALMSYVRASSEDPGLTTEIALLLTYLLGALSLSEPGLAAALGVAVAILLAGKSNLHRFAQILLTPQEIHDGLLLLASALIVLPLLPAGTIDPWGVLEIRKLWAIVVLIMAISAAGPNRQADGDDCPNTVKRRADAGLGKQAGEKRGHVSFLSAGARNELSAPAGLRQAKRPECRASSELPADVGGPALAGCYTGGDAHAVTWVVANKDKGEIGMKPPPPIRRRLDLKAMRPAGGGNEFLLLSLVDDSDGDQIIANAYCTLPPPEHTLGQTGLTVEEFLALWRQGERHLEQATLPQVDGVIAACRRAVRGTDV